MNSKEALEHIKKSHYVAMALLIDGKRDEKTEEAISIIQKDLEMLEMLKSQFTIEKAQFGSDEMIYFKGNYIGAIQLEEQLGYLDDDEELLKIKEWLKNE